MAIINPFPNLSPLKMTAERTAVLMKESQDVVIRLTAEQLIVDCMRRNEWQMHDFDNRMSFSLKLGFICDTDLVRFVMARHKLSR